MLFNLAAAAAATPASSSNQIITLVLYVAVFGGIMYFLIIRPQKKKQKAEAKMRNDLIVGDEITTIGGVMGRVISVKDDSIILESGPDKSKQKYARWAIQTNHTIHDN